MISSAKILGDVEHLQSLPVSFARIYAMANDPESSMDDLVEALKPDPALTANVLRLANSPYFGCRRQITSIKQAMMLLGTKKVVQVAIGGTYSRVIPTVLPGYGVTASAFWGHSIAVAILSEMMAEELKLDDGDGSFVCGLLHDIGKLVTSAYLAEEQENIVETLDQGSAFVDAEKEIMALNHAEVGFAVAEKWELPEVICATARWHHTPADRENKLIDIVHVADCLAHSLGFGADIGGLSREIDPKALARVGIPQADLEKIVAFAMSSIESMSAIYNETSGDE